MRNSEHTPGPWKRSGFNGWDIVGVDNSVVAKVLPWDESGCRKEDHANVDLIAAAPEMKLLIEKIYDGIHRGVGPMSGASDGEIAYMINDEMSNLLGNGWRSVV